MSLPLHEVPGLPDPDVRPPVIAESGDPFASLRVAHLLARLDRGVPVRLRDIVDQLNSDYLDWSFSRSVVAAVAVQMQANWVADFRTSLGFDLSDGDRGEELIDRGLGARGAVACSPGRAIRVGVPGTLAQLRAQRGGRRPRAASPGTSRVAPPFRRCVPPPSGW